MTVLRNFRPFTSIWRNFTSHRALQQCYQSNTAKFAKNFSNSALQRLPTAKRRDASLLPITIPSNVSSPSTHVWSWNSIISEPNKLKKFTRKTIYWIITYFSWNYIVRCWRYGSQGVGGEFCLKIIIETLLVWIRNWRFGSLNNALTLCKSLKHPLYVCKTLKGQFHESFDTFFYQKTSPGPHFNRQKRFTKFFNFAEMFAIKRVSTQSLTTLHTVNYFTLEKVKRKLKKIVTNTVIWTFSKIRWLRRHRVGVIVDYADTLNTRT